MATLIQTLARIILPAKVRRPVADVLYRTRDRYRITGLPSLPPASAHVRRGVTRFAAAVAMRPVRAVESLGRRWLVRRMPLLWSPARPSPLDRVRLAAVRVALSSLDALYERRFAALLRKAVDRKTTTPTLTRVFFAIGTLGPGGAERQMTNVLLGLKSRYGVQPQTVVAYLDNESQSFFEPVLTAAGMPVDALPRSGHPLTALAGCGHPDAPRLAAAIAATLPVALHDVALYTREFLLRNPHVVHLWLDEVNIKAGLGAALAGVPRIVLSTRSLNPSHFPLFQPYMRAGYRVLTRRPHVVFLNNSTTGARDYEEWLGVTRGTCTVISNGFDFSSVSTAEPAQTRAAARRRFGFPETAPVIGGVMRLSVEKRPLLWLDVAARVLRDHPEARFLLVGDGTMRDAVAARAAQPPLADRVMLTGHVPQPYDTIPAMDLLFLSSRHEGLPNVLIEAQALGIAVVTMPAGGAAETIDPGGSGWVVPTDDVDAAAGIISGAIADREMLQRAGERGRAFVRERFGLERLIDETVAIYGVGDARIIGRPSEIA